MIIFRIYSKCKQSYLWSTPNSFFFTAAEPRILLLYPFCIWVLSGWSIPHIPFYFLCCWYSCHYAVVLWFALSEPNNSSIPFKILHAKLVIPCTPALWVYRFRIKECWHFHHYRTIIFIINITLLYIYIVF